MQQLELSLTICGEVTALQKFKAAFSLKRFVIADGIR